MLYFLTKILKPSVVLETVRTPEAGRERRRVLPFKPGESYRTEWVSKSVLQTKSEEEEDLQQPAALQKSEERKEAEIERPQHQRQQQEGKGLWRTQEEGKAERRSLSLTD
jgi:hypothetical protein